jgi:Uma2 family endonuclease
MTSEEFLAWYDEQPEGHRYELLDGEPIRIMADCEVEIGFSRVLMQAETEIHAIAKGEVFAQLRDEIRRRGLPCRAYTDRMAVRIDETTVFEPDAMVRCGPARPPSATAVADPLIVVEVASGRRHKVDTEDKLSRYFDNPHLVHYLIVLTKRRRIIHHRRIEGLELLTSIHARGALPLDPPGLSLDLDALFAALPADDTMGEDS